MNINRHNCESFFLDYYEKNLSPVEVAEVLFFLEENPEMKEVFESYEAVFLEHEKVNFPDKESLKKKYSKEELDLILSSDINRSNCEQFFVASAEEILSDGQTRKLYAFLAANPELKKDFELIQKCKLTAEKISFEHKDLLKKDTVNSQNREDFFIRAIEGGLSAAEQQQLVLFLQKYPEYNKEFELFKQTILPQEKISFEYKNQLRKEEINVQNREEYFIRAIDKDLSLAEQKQLGLFLAKNPEYKKEFDLFKQTILLPEQIPFEFKSELKKRERKPIFVSLFSQRSAYYAAAAAVLILAGLFFFFRSDDATTTYIAGKADRPNNTIANVQPGKENNTLTGTKENSIPETNQRLNNRAEPAVIKNNISVNKNSILPEPEPKEEKNIFQPLLSNDNTEEALLAKKAEDKKSEQEQIENTAVAKNTEAKIDSLPTEASAQAGVATTTATVNEAIASTANPQKETDEYQTLASFANKKIRSVLGIKKSTECETSDKIDLWALAMAAKKGVQKVIGTKMLDVNKVCDETGEKVEYVFTAGNFEISKNASK